MSKFKEGDWAFYIGDRSWKKVLYVRYDCVSFEGDARAMEWACLTEEEAKRHNFGEPPKEKVKKKVYAYLIEFANTEKQSTYDLRFFSTIDPKDCGNYAPTTLIRAPWLDGEIEAEE